MANQKHLDLDARFVIQTSLDNGESFKQIGAKLGKDCTTISKEVRKHLVFERKGAVGNPFNDCLNRYHCEEENLCSTCTRTRRTLCKRCSACIHSCPQYMKETCPKLSKPPYVCNGCKMLSRCTLEKRKYSAKSSQQEYQQTLTESRSGINLNEAELKHINDIITPLIENGQSVHHICVSYADSLMRSEKTIYSYIDSGLFKARNIDLPRKVRFKPRKKGGATMKVDKKCRVGRTLEEYKQYVKEHPELPVTELDSVEGVRGGKVLLTIHFVQPKLQLAFLRETNDSHSVTQIFENLLRTLGVLDYHKLFPLLLADNGSEFSNPTAIEFVHKGERISRLFYCDPSAPGQKGHCENNHEFIRRIIPKGTDLGKYTQAQINLAMNHINSYGRPEMMDRSPYEMFSFLYGEDLLRKLGVIKIPRNEIILKPKLLS